MKVPCARLRRPLARVAVALGLLALPSASALAQESRRYAEEPTDGIRLPVTPLAGDHDATAVSVNPAGLSFLGSSYLGLALDLDGDETTSGGQGGGLFFGKGRGFLPLGFGLGLEWVRPERSRLAPDPGTPLRFTLASSLALGPSASLGVSWHHFFDDPGSTTDGLGAWDVGLSVRLGNRLALGAVVRDLNGPVADGVLVQRRYEAELVSRPVATDRLMLGLGGRIGEVRGDVDGWLRGSVRVARGVYLEAEGESRALHLLETTGTGTSDTDDREWRLTAGLSLSFGGLGVRGYGSAAVDADGDARLGGGSVILRISGEEVPSVQGPRRRIERIELSGDIGEQDLTAIEVRLRDIARDPAVAAVFVAIDSLGIGWGSAQELHEELLKVRAAGKKVFAYMVAGTSRDYFVAAAADKIYVDPAGGLRLAGMAGTTMYFKGLFDLIGVAAQFEKIAEYKSAPESYTMTGPSEPALRMRNELYNSIFEEMVASVARARKLDVAVVKELIDRGPFSAGDLMADHRLVDAVATPDELDALVAKELGGLYEVSGPPDKRPERWSLPAIAVIYVDGDIVDGKSRKLPIALPLIGSDLVGGETIAEAIATARADRRVAAIVLRINSPGGSALASEIISREVFKTRKVKPIICSMGDVAASGGYYAAAGCDTIFAEPMTITGSIGIFYGKFDLSGLLSRLGVSWDTFKRGKNADMESIYHPYTEEERSLIREKMQYLYGRFTGAVSAGRGLTVPEVDAVGRGHVWSGLQARPIKLVDQFGALADAIALAKSRSGLGERDDVQLMLLPRESGGLLGLLLRLAGVARAKAGAEVGATAALPLLDAVFGAVPPSLLAEPAAPQARLPFRLVWE